MKHSATLVEYGTPIDAATMVAPHEDTVLQLEAGHPGAIAGYRTTSGALSASATRPSGRARRSTVDVQSESVEGRVRSGRVLLELDVQTD